MTKLKTWLRKFARDESGLTATEYAVAGSLVALAVVAAFTDLGGAISDAIYAIIGVIGP